MWPKFDEYRIKLSLKTSDDVILRCHGRIEGDYPTYLPDNDPSTEKLVEYARNVTLHGGS